MNEIQAGKLWSCRVFYSTIPGTECPYPGMGVANMVISKFSFVSNASCLVQLK